MRMQKRKFRIGYLARHLAIERFVIRFWEKEFNIKPSRSEGGQRFYDEQDLAIFTEIKELLYKRGFTIAGAKKHLATFSNNHTIIASQKTTLSSVEEKESFNALGDSQYKEKLIQLKNQLITFRQIIEV